MATALVPFLAALTLAGANPAGADAFGHHAVPFDHEHTVVITAKDPLTYDIDTRGTVPAGPVHIEFGNAGSGLHQAQLFRLNDGVTIAQWEADLNGPNPNKAFTEDAAPTGGAAPILPGAHQEVWDVLQGGTYMVVSFVPGPDGVPDVFKGMFKSFDIAGTLSAQDIATERELVEDESPCCRITGHDLTYTAPAVIRTGSVIRFDDTDAKDVHELNLGKLAPGKTVADAKAWFVKAFATPPVDPGPPPFTYMGGHGADLPGHGGWFKVQADPGSYIAFCLVPDEATGVPHAAMGMVVGLSIV